MFEDNSLVLCLSQSFYLVYLCLEEEDSLVLLYPRYALLETFQLVMQHIVSHLRQRIGIAQCHTHGLAFFHSERFALAEFLQRRFDKCQRSADVVRRIDEEVDFFIRYMYRIGRHIVFTHQEENKHKNA